MTRTPNEHDDTADMTASASRILSKKDAKDLSDPRSRRAAWQKLMERIQSQPTVDIGPWTRDELYER